MTADAPSLHNAPPSPAAIGPDMLKNVSEDVSESMAEAGDIEGMAIEPVVVEDEDLVLVLEGRTSLLCQAGGRVLDADDFDNPDDLDEPRFSITTMRTVHTEGGVIHVDLTQAQDLADVIDHEEIGDTLDGQRLHWLRRRWDNGDGGIIFWDDVRLRDSALWGRRVEAPWEWSGHQVVRRARLSIA